MSSTFRLDSVSTIFADKFRTASPAQHRQAAFVACQLAVQSAGLEGEIVADALSALRPGSAVGGPRRDDLERLAGDLDQAYFQLERDDEPTTQEGLLLFFKARAAAALGFALSKHSAELHEAIYEAIMSMDDPAEVIRAVEGALA